MTVTALSKEKLFAYLIVEDIQIKEELVIKAKVNDAESLSKIADIYYEKRDYLKAMDWFRLAANVNNAYSQWRLGYMYQYGEGVSIDYKLAMEWYLEAANKGNKNAQYNVGIFYEDGYSVSKDKQYALEWYERSAEQGYEKAKICIKRINKEGFYLNERQKRYLQIEKDINELRDKSKELENKLKIVEEKLQEAKQKEKEKENEIRILKQEIQLLKLEKINNKNEQLNLGRNNGSRPGNQALEMIIASMVVTAFIFFVIS